MKVYNIIEPSHISDGLKTTLTVGTFDGIHIGHQIILKKVAVNAKKTGEQSAVLTFDCHPAEILKPGSAPKLLTTLNEKLSLIDNSGIDITFVVSFTREMSEMSAEQFTKKYLIDCLGMSHFILGYDHHFGKERNGTSDILMGLSKKYSFSFETQKPVTYNGMIVKSSTIRAHLLEGNVNAASVLLGKDYSFRGYVIAGYGRGMKIGVPTANISFTDPEKIIPLSGVYAGWIEFNGHKREAVLSLGSRPTFNINDETIEAHILEFNGDLYKKEVRVGFTRRLRNIEKFKSEEALIRQIKKDIEVIK